MTHSNVGSNNMNNEENKITKKNYLSNGIRGLQFLAVPTAIVVGTLVIRKHFEKVEDILKVNNLYLDYLTDFID